MEFDKQLKILESSRQFHKNWYGTTYPEVKQRGMKPEEHYLLEGAQKGFNPGKFFDTTLYVSRYPDVSSSGMNPLVHYEQIGAAENRAINAAKAAAEDRKILAAAEKAAAKKAAPKKAAPAKKPAAKAATKPAAKAAPKPAAKAPTPPVGASPALYGTTLDKLSRQARTAASKGDWLTASRHWQDVLSLPAEPYVGLSEAAAGMGDMARAEKIVLDGLERYENNPKLLEQYCTLALKQKRWMDVPDRWRQIETSGCIVEPKLKVAVAEAYIMLGDLDRGAALLDTVRSGLSASTQVLKLDATLAEAREEWAKAADIWLQRGLKSKDVVKRNSNIKAVRAFIQADDLDRAEQEAQLMVSKFPKEVAYLKLLVEVAIAQDAWAVALERWQRVEVADPSQAGVLPSQWIYDIGLEQARTRTENIRIGRLRATGMLSLASTIETVDEAGALLLARQARKAYPEKVSEMVARILSANTRHSAAIWWLERLIAQSKAPKRFYPRLIESLLECSRLDDCRDILETYVQKYGRDTLWLRTMVEIHYRDGNFAEMRNVMQMASDGKLKGDLKTVRVLRWLYDLIRLHPNPQSFLPEEIHDLVLRTAALYDSKFLSDSIAVLLNPAKGDALAETYAEQLDAASDNRIDLDPTIREEILQFFLRRRDWDRVQIVLDLPMPDDLTEANMRKVWNIVRNKLDILLGQANVSEAEVVACAFLDQLGARELDGYTLTLVTNLLYRLPLSQAVADRFMAAATRVGFTQMVKRIEDWKGRYANFDTSTTVGLAKRERCFIVGNAPSIADMPLHLLEGEDIFSVNRGMRATDVGLPQPKYLMVADPLVYKNHADEIDNDGTTVDKFFVASNCLWRKPPTVPCIPVGSSGLKLSLAPFKHAPLHLHRGETVVVLAAQIAHLMGYKEIYIIGVDLDYSGPATHFYVKDGGGKKETERLANFRPGGSGTEMVNLAFASLQEAVVEDGCRLYNAAPAGKLDMLERVNFTSLFEGAAEATSIDHAPQEQAQA